MHLVTHKPLFSRVGEKWESGMALQDMFMAQHSLAAPCTTPRMGRELCWGPAHLPKKWPGVAQSPELLPL